MKKPFLFSQPNHASITLQPVLFNRVDHPIFFYLIDHSLKENLLISIHNTLTTSPSQSHLIDHEIEYPCFSANLKDKRLKYSRKELTLRFKFIVCESCTHQSFFHQYRLLNSRNVNAQKTRINSKPGVFFCSSSFG